MLTLPIFLLLAALAGFAIGFRSSRQYHRRVFARQIERHLRQAAEAEARPAA
jgi:hypothetical protein